MEIKLVELRDRGTFIPYAAIKISGDDGPLARRAGYRDACVLFGRIDGVGKLQYDPYAWGDRTLAVAYLLGERVEPCESECGS